MVQGEQPGQKTRAKFNKTLITKQKWEKKQRAAETNKTKTEM